MLYSVKNKLHPGVRARDLPALMELYEINYIQLRQLMPDMDALPRENISKHEAVLALHLKITERCKYTTTFQLTYEFKDEKGVFIAPDLVVRMYHDAQVAEVISRGRRRGNRQAEYDRFHQNHSLESKWRVNRFLQKWLGYCLRQNHRFSPAQNQLSMAQQAVEDSCLLNADVE